MGLMRNGALKNCNDQSKNTCFIVCTVFSPIWADEPTTRVNHMTKLPRENPNRPKLSSAEAYRAVLSFLKGAKSDLKGAKSDLVDLNLSRFPTLSELPIDENPNLRDFPEIRRVNLDRTKISNLSALSHLRRIESLNLVEVPISSLDGLFLSKLSQLSVAQTNLEDLSPLVSAKGLQILDISQTKITDLSPLANLEELRVLYLSGSSISDLSPIRRLTNLRILLFDGTPVTEISALKKLNSLNRLSFSNTNVSDVNPLAQLTYLEELDFHETRVSDIGALSDLRNLRRLNISDTKVTDLSIIANLTSLTSKGSDFDFNLSVKDCPIKDPELVGRFN
jgi:Leucine-rich repeat (LRR) protein